MQTTDILAMEMDMLGTGTVPQRALALPHRREEAGAAGRLCPAIWPDSGALF